MSRPALAATRAVAVLDFLAAHPTEGFTLSDLAARLGINLASAHALLTVLADAGYVTRHPRLKTFALGASVVALGSAALETHPAIDIARDAAKRLSDDVDLEVALTALAGDDIVFLARAGTHRARGIAVHVGQRVPLVPPLGAVFMAWAEDAAVADWHGRGPAGATSEAILAFVRERGYSVALEGEARRGLGEALDHLADAPFDDGAKAGIDALVGSLARNDYQVASLEPQRRYEVSMIAAPVFDIDGRAPLALTLLGFERDLEPAEIAVYGQRVRDAGIVVTKQSGGRVPG